MYKAAYMRTVLFSLSKHTLIHIYAFLLSFLRILFNVFTPSPILFVRMTYVSPITRFQHLHDVHIKHVYKVSTDDIITDQLIDLCVDV